MAQNTPDRTEPQCPVRHRVPVTLLTGFLGSGKTTRLNATLASGWEKIAVIENEIGSLGVDGLMVANTHDDGVIELNNGCLCCTAEVDLVSALEGLARRRATRPFDRVIIETTGLADVGPVASFLQDQEDPLSENFVFDSVITVVDAAAVVRWMDNGSDGPCVPWASGFGTSTASDTVPLDLSPAKIANDRARLIFWRQVSMADWLVFSKADLIPQDALAMVQSAASAVNPLAAHAQVNGSDSRCLLPPAAMHQSSRQAIPRQPPTLSTQKRRRHLEGFQTLTLRPPPERPIRADRLKVFVNRLLDGSIGREPNAEEHEVWRVKGFVVTEDFGLALIQGVGDQVSVEPWKGVAKELVPFLVVIGQGLCTDVVENALVDYLPNVTRLPVSGEAESTQEPGST